MDKASMISKSKACVGGWACIWTSSWIYFVTLSQNKSTMMFSVETQRACQELMKARRTLEVTSHARSASVARPHVLRTE